MKIEIIRFINTPEQVIEFVLHHEQVKYAINPFFSEGGYSYVLENNTMFVIAPELIDNTGKIKNYNYFKSNE